MTRRGWALFATMCVIWGVPYLLIKVAVRDLSTPTVVFARTALAALLLVPVAARRGQLRPLLARRRWLLAFCVIEIAAPWFLLTDAERRLSSSLSGLLVAATPIVGVVLARLLDGERVGPLRALGLALGLGGVAALLGFDVRGGDLLAAGEVLLVAVGYATGPVIAARRFGDLPSLGTTAAAVAVTALGYAPFALTHLPDRVPAASVLAAVATLGVLCTATAFLVFFALIAEVGPARATVITYVNPAVAVALGVAVLGEPFGPAAGAGFVLVLTGSWLATRRDRLTRSAEEPEVLAA